MFETKREAYVKGLIRHNGLLREADVKLSEENKILRASLERKEDMFGGLERQLHEQNKYLNKKIKELERRLEERRTSQRDTDARIRAEARSLGVDTFMGFSIADHVEAMDVAEELARSVRKYGSQSHAGEIASRFLKLRTPPAPKKVVTRLHCPKCEALAGEEGSHGKITHYFCPNYKCGWRCEA